MTKPLGTGTICAGIKREELKDAEFAEALSSMKRLNNITDYLSIQEKAAIHGATDVTGFGLAGHSYQVAKASKVTLVIELNKLPLFALTRSCLEKGWLTKAHRSNEEYTQDKIQYTSSDMILKLATFDPQTSGGLLLSVDSALARQIVKSLGANFPGTAIIGKVGERKDFDVIME